MSEPSGESTTLPYHSKTLASWLALLAGTIGAHRLYLGSRGWWAYPLISMPMLAWALEGDRWFTEWPFFFGALVTVTACGESILFALMPDSKWDARYNAGGPPRARTGVAAVLAAIIALLLGTILLMSLLAIFQQKFFEMLI